MVVVLVNLKKNTLEVEVDEEGDTIIEFIDSNESNYGGLVLPMAIKQLTDESRNYLGFAKLSTTPQLPEIPTKEVSLKLFELIPNVNIYFLTGSRFEIVSEIENDEYRLFEMLDNRSIKTNKKFNVIFEKIENTNASTVPKSIIIPIKKKQLNEDHITKPLQYISSISKSFGIYLLTVQSQDEKNQ